MKSFISKSVMIATALFALAACDLPGTITATQNTSLIDHNGKTFTMLANRTYGAAISKDDGMLQIKVKDVNGHDYKVKIAPPPGQSVPQQEGEMMATAAQSGQPVDMHGVVHTDVVNGPEQSGVQTCYTYRPVQVCGQIVHHGHVEYECHWENRQVPGQQNVAFHMEQSTTTGQIHFMTPGTQNVTAQFYGQSVSNNQVIDQQGPCFSGY